MTLWQWLLAVLASLSADPHAMDRETPKAAAAVAVAYAATAAAPTPAPEPTPPAPKPDGKCEACGGKGYIVHGDGHRTVCPHCKGCPDGRCPTGAALTPGGPARPAGERTR